MDYDFQEPNPCQSAWRNQRNVSIPVKSEPLDAEYRVPINGTTAGSHKYSENTNYRNEQIAINALEIKEERLQEDCSNGFVYNIQEIKEEPQSIDFKYENNAASYENEDIHQQSSSGLMYPIKELDENLNFDDPNSPTNDNEFWNATTTATTEDGNHFFEYKKVYQKVGNQYICTLCVDSPKYSATNSVRHHIKISHQGYRYVCSICGKEYMDQLALKKHYRKIHNEEQGDLNFGIPTRRVINREVLEQQEQQQQLLLANSFAASYDEDETKFEIRSAFEKIGNYFICKLCDHDSANKYAAPGSVRHHVKLRHLGYRYICTECSKPYMDSPALRNHYIKEHEKYHGIIELGKPTKEQLEQSQQDPQKLLETMNKCSYANTYEKVSDYYMCRLCGDYATPKNSLSAVRRHVKFYHFGYRYRCTDCEKSYVDARKLRHHYKQIHNKEAPEKLDIFKMAKPSTAPLEYPRKVCFTDTFRSVRNKFQCMLCTETQPRLEFTTAFSVRRHIKIDHYGYRFVCERCGSNFLRGGSLRRHYKQLHKIVEGVIKLQIPTKPISHQRKDLESKKSIQTANAQQNEEPQQQHQQNDEDEDEDWEKDENFKFDYSNIIARKENFYFCKLCPNPSKYLTRNSVRKHVQKIHYGMKYACTVCNVKYLQARSLKDHYRRDHNITPPPGHMKIVFPKNNQLVEKDRKVDKATKKKSEKQTDNRVKIDDDDDDGKENAEEVQQITVDCNADEIFEHSQADTDDEQDELSHENEHSSFANMADDEYEDSFVNVQLNGNEQQQGESLNNFAEIGRYEYDDDDDGGEANDDDVVAMDPLNDSIKSEEDDANDFENTQEEEDFAVFRNFENEQTNDSGDYSLSYQLASAGCAMQSTTRNNTHNSSGEHQAETQYEFAEPKEKLCYENTFKKVENSYVCKLCASGSEKPYATSNAVRRHIKRTHYGYRYVCTICDTKYKGPYGLKKHYEVKHNAEAPKKFKIFKRVETEVLPISKDLLNRVRAEQFRFTPEYIKRVEETNFSSVIEKIDDLYYCTLCIDSSKYTTPRYIRKHIQLSHFGYRYSCKECNDGNYMDPKSVRIHYKRDHNKTEGSYVFAIPNVEKLKDVSNSDDDLTCFYPDISINEEQDEV